MHAEWQTQIETTDEKKEVAAKDVRSLLLDKEATLVGL